jgi:hypothetical protein
MEATRPSRESASGIVRDRTNKMKKRVDPMVNTKA